MCVCQFLFHIWLMLSIQQNFAVAELGIVERGRGL